MCSENVDAVSQNSKHTNDITQLWTENSARRTVSCRMLNEYRRLIKIIAYPNKGAEFAVLKVCWNDFLLKLSRVFDYKGLPAVLFTPTCDGLIAAINHVVGFFES